MNYPIASYYFTNITNDHLFIHLRHINTSGKAILLFLSSHFPCYKGSLPYYVKYAYPGFRIGRWTMLPPVLCNCFSATARANQLRLLARSLSIPMHSGFSRRAVLAPSFPTLATSLPSLSSSSSSESPTRSLHYARKRHGKSQPILESCLRRGGCKMISFSL